MLLLHCTTQAFTLRLGSCVCLHLLSDLGAMTSMLPCSCCVWHVMRQAGNCVQAILVYHVQSVLCYDLLLLLLLVIAISSTIIINIFFSSSTCIVITTQPPKEFANMEARGALRWWSAPSCPQGGTVLFTHDLNLLLAIKVILSMAHMVPYWV